MVSPGSFRAGQFKMVENRHALGWGSSGIVFLYRHEKTGEFVAVKHVDTSIVENYKTIERELSAIRILSPMRNANLVQVFETHEVFAERRLRIVMEYCNGGDFEQYLQRMGKRPESELQCFSQQIANGISTLRAVGIVHRDLKPANILLYVSKGGEAREMHNEELKYTDIVLKIADFGSCKKLSETKNISTYARGTFLYMAPEVLQWVGNKHGRDVASYTEKADLWSLGMILYASLCGRKELSDLDPTDAVGGMNYGPNTVGKEVLKQLQSNVQSRVPSLPSTLASKELQCLLGCLLQVDPADRLDYGLLAEHPFLTDTKPDAKLSHPYFMRCLIDTKARDCHSTNQQVTIGRLQLGDNPELACKKLATIYSKGIGKEAVEFSWKVFGHTATFTFGSIKDGTREHRFGSIRSGDVGAWNFTSVSGKHVFCDPFQHYMATLCDKKLVDEKLLIQVLSEQPDDKLLPIYKNEAICRIRGVKN
ncbi:hypothetical protein RvY_15059 [Ramazzottius varieornatus]|uniref:Protein kinase domain-containing protein n=1 Tax=Ramazzottius varieornatus TaxID=947166 RepID=A0A1D1VTI2_RAMVA|nr:hypothetical protein RvY_15059 [Ramazzottius varieornatus]